MSTVLVTGANRGIGLELCRQLKARGDDVIAVCRASSSDLDALGVRVEAQVDVTSDPSVAALVTRLAGTKLDVLVNNAGDFKMLPLPGEHGPRVASNELAADVASLFAINIIPPSALAHVLRHLQLRASHPKQLDVLSSAALEIFPGNNPYGVTKVAHERLSLAVVAETRARLKTYRVYPSNTDTRIVAGFSVPKLTPGYVGEQAVAMMHEGNATDLYLKMTNSGPVVARGLLRYEQFLQQDGLAFDGLALVRAHRALLEQELMPAAESSHQ